MDARSALDAALDIAVSELVADLIFDAVSSTVMPTTRETVEAVALLADDNRARGTWGQGARPGGATSGLSAQPCNAIQGHVGQGEGLPGQR